MRITVRVYEELNRYLRLERRKTPFDAQVPPGTRVGELIRRLRIPEDEVDLVLINGASVDLAHSLAEGDRVSVYPVFESLDITPASRLTGRPLRRPSFLLEPGLDPLARHLRDAGYPVRVLSASERGHMARLSREEGHILVTRDTSSSDAALATRRIRLHTADPDAQFLGILNRLQLDRSNLDEP